MTSRPSSLRIESPSVAFSRGANARRVLRRLGPLLFTLAAGSGAFFEALHDYRAASYTLLGTVALSLGGCVFYALSGAWRGRASPGSIEVTDGRISVRRGTTIR